MASSPIVIDAALIVAAPVFTVTPSVVLSFTVSAPESASEALLPVRFNRPPSRSTLACVSVLERVRVPSPSLKNWPLPEITPESVWAAV